MGIMRTKKWIALGSVLMTLLAAGVALGEDYEPCYAAYRSSGMTEQQMPFKDFHELYSETICA